MKKKIVIFEVIFILVFLFVVYKNYIYDNKKYNELNTYYSKDGIEFDIHRGYINNFSNLINTQKFDEAYELLTEDAKSFYGDIDNFKNVILTKYANPNYVEKEFLLEVKEPLIEEGKRVTVVESINMLKDVNEYVKMPNTDEAREYYNNYNVEFKVIENAPYDYKIYVEL